jgi:hypothetical protein
MHACVCRVFVCDARLARIRLVRFRTSRRNGKDSIDLLQVRFFNRYGL